MASHVKTATATAATIPTEVGAGEPDDQQRDELAEGPHVWPLPAAMLAAASASPGDDDSQVTTSTSDAIKTIQRPQPICRPMAWPNNSVLCALTWKASYTTPPRPMFERFTHEFLYPPTSLGRESQGHCRPGSLAHHDDAFVFASSLDNSSMAAWAPASTSWSTTQLGPDRGARSVLRSRSRSQGCPGSDPCPGHEPARSNRPTRVGARDTGQTPRSRLLHKLIQAPALACHRRFDRPRKAAVADEQPEFDVAILGVVGEVRTRQQDDFVVDDDELGVADDRPARRAGSPTGRPWRGATAP